MSAKKKEIDRLSAMIKKYDELIANEERLLKRQAKNIVGIGANVLARSSIVSQHQSEAVESDHSMMRSLRKCELLHKMKFANEQIQQLSSNLYRYEATGFSGPVEFHICFEVEHPNNGDEEVGVNRNVKSIDINFREPFHTTEISLWLTNCLRNNDLQTILRNIPLYGELYESRGKIVEWLENSYPRFFTVDIRTEVGGIFITAHSEQRDTYFEAEWKIIKEHRHQSVCSSLFFSVYDSFATTELLEKCEDALKSLAEDSALTFDSLMSNWKIVANTVAGGSE